MLQGARLSESKLQSSCSAEAGTTYLLRSTRQGFVEVNTFIHTAGSHILPLHGTRLVMILHATQSVRSLHEQSADPPSAAVALRRRDGLCKS